MGLFNSDKVIITDSGQKVVSLEPILEEVKGLDVIDVDTGDADVDTLETNVTEDTELPQYANYDSYVELSAMVTALETRIAKLESLLDVTDMVGDEKNEVVELW